MSEHARTAHKQCPHATCKPDHLRQDKARQIDLFCATELMHTQKHTIHSYRRLGALNRGEAWLPLVTALPLGTHGRGGMGCDHWRGEVARSASGEAELPEFPGVAVVLVDRLIYGAGVDLAGPVAVDRLCGVAEKPGRVRLWLGADRFASGAPFGF
jgi:hypothetical protein